MIHNKLTNLYFVINKQNRKYIINNILYILYMIYIIYQISNMIYNIW